MFRDPQGGAACGRHGGPDQWAKLSWKGVHMRTLIKTGGLTAAAGTALVAQAASAQATGTLTDLGAAADFGDVKTVMISIAVAVMGVLVLWFGIRKAKHSISG